MFAMTCGPEQDKRRIIMSTSGKIHWQRVYGEKGQTEVSWYQPVPEKSLQFIRLTGIAKDEPILDAGGGASTLVDHLMHEGYTNISVLDISGKALERSRDRLGDSGGAITWIESDVTEFEPSRQYALWHDRAVFHFLTRSDDRDKYIEVVCRALQPMGHLVLATFGPQGPERCSGLDIQRYGVDELQNLFGSQFDLCGHELDEHETPSGATQQFLYSRWRART